MIYILYYFLASYFHVCGRKDPNYDQCITENIKAVKDKLCTGFPEINIPSYEPIVLDKVIIFDTNDVKLYLRDMKVYGFCDLVVNSVRTNLERNHFDLDILFRHLYLNATYDFDIRLLVRIANKGPVEATSENVRMKAGMDLKTIIKNDKKHIYASKVNNILEIKSFKHKFNDDTEELAQLHSILNDVIANNKKDVIYAIKLAMEETVSKIIISIFNVIARSNYEEIFPERT
ncbi:hypothetical protein ALC62_06302 [Cyphomyrmex costatus]|uniref:Circadian clock-controlled protein n=1 Tax=Cyphomyrmex costatus TaxID=456900 RepID=A0A151IJ41_9HYME|nr:hypothetical protein ALC62_06302 [Cyphomyrmex costatus]